MPDETAQLKLGIARETFPGERRVAALPETVAQYTKQKLNISVEPKAGAGCGIDNEAFTSKGASIAADRDALFESCDIILQVRTVGTNPDNGRDDIARYRSGQVLIGHFDPLTNPSTVKEIAPTGVTAFAIETLPRITRAQSMDALSSMATIAGYKAVLMAAEACPKMFPLLMTAAGTISPAHVFVVGAGVAGLQAIATSRRLGAVVKAYDIRPAVKEQVESLGAKFVELKLETGAAEDKGGYAREMDEEFYRRQRELMASIMAQSDVVITTAAVPGKKAPILITKEMVDRMPEGSVIVDIAAERGGNCELTKPGETVEATGVRIIGPVNLPATVPFHASQMYSRNLLAFVKHLLQNGGTEPNTDDEIIRETLLTYRGEVVHKQVRELLDMSTAPEQTAEEK